MEQTYLPNWGSSRLLLLSLVEMVIGRQHGNTSSSSSRQKNTFLLPPGGGENDVMVYRLLVLLLTTAGVDHKIHVSLEVLLPLLPQLWVDITRRCTSY